jgi:GMP synthase (glutamine-hydrolysing)
MSRILVFQHVAAEPLGTLNALMRKRGHPLRFVNFERNPQAQPSVDHYQGLVVLGGPMNVQDLPQRPHLRTELQVIERALEQDKPVLGICLGAQLLAHVLGAPVGKHAQSEIGWYRLRLTDAGRGDPVLSPLGVETSVFQWHSCSFAMPAGAVHLAETDTCQNQAFRYGEKAYGLQFHLEASANLIERWLATPEYAAELLPAQSTDPAEVIRQRTRHLVHVQQARAESVFNRFLDLVGPAPYANRQACVQRLALPLLSPSIDPDQPHAPYRRVMPRSLLDRKRRG